MSILNSIQPACGTPIAINRRDSSKDTPVPCERLAYNVLGPHDAD